MPKQRHGCSFTQRWTKVVCILAHCQCDYRIVKSVYDGLTNAINELFLSYSHIPLCTKTFGPRKRHHLGNDFVMCKNGMVVDVLVGRKFYNLVIVFNLYYNKPHRYALHNNTTQNNSFRYISKRISCHNVIFLLNTLAVLSKCDFRFWKQLFHKYADELETTVIIPDIFRVISSCGMKLFLYWGFIRIEFISETNSYTSVEYYYHPWRPNVDTLFDFLKSVSSPFGWPEGCSLDAHLERICIESHTEEIRDFLNVNNI